MNSPSISTQQHFSRYAARYLVATLIMPVATLAASGLAANGDEFRPTWECLPEETVVAFRVPDAKSIAKLLVDQTKLGAVLLDEGRVNTLRDFLMEQNFSLWKDLHNDLKEFGFKAEDLQQLCSGAVGFAVVVDPMSGDELQAAGIGWLAPGEEQSTRVWDAIGKAVELHADDEYPIERIDTTAAGQPVMQFTTTNTDRRPLTRRLRRIVR